MNTFWILLILTVGGHVHKGDAMTPRPFIEGPTLFAALWWLAAAAVAVWSVTAWILKAIWS